MQSKGNELLLHSKNNKIIIEWPRGSILGEGSEDPVFLSQTDLCVSERNDFLSIYFSDTLKLYDKRGAQVFYYQL